MAERNVGHHPWDDDASTEIAAFGQGMRARAQDIFLAADLSISDGSAQVVGEYTVRIITKPSGDHEVRTVFLAQQGDTPVAEYVKTSNERGLTVSDLTRVHGEVDGARVTLTHIRSHMSHGRRPSVHVSVPNPHLVRPGGIHSMSLRAHNPAYIARVRQAFGIPQ